MATLKDLSEAVWGKKGVLEEAKEAARLETLATESAARGFDAVIAEKAKLAGHDAGPGKEADKMVEHTNLKVGDIVSILHSRFGRDPKIEKQAAAPVAKEGTPALKKFAALLEKKPPQEAKSPAVEEGSHFQKLAARIQKQGSEEVSATKKFAAILEGAFKKEKEAARPQGK